MENTEMKNGETDAVDAIIAWLDERIDRTEKTMSAGEDDFSWLADREYLQAYRNARSLHANRENVGAGRNGRLQKHEPRAYRQPKPAQVEP